MPRKAGGKRRKRRTHPDADEAPAEEGRSALDDTPRSFVFRRGHVPNAVRDLVPDLRAALMPFTALRLKERNSNSIRDYLSVASPIGVSHFWILSATSTAPYLRIARTPQGPTLTFRLHAYSLCKSVRAAQRRPSAFTDADLRHPPLLVLHNFAGGGKEVSLMAETFRHSFPGIDVNSAQLSALRRVLVVHRDTESGRVYLRHYALKVQPAGLSRPVRKMVTKRRVPNLSSLADVSQLMDDATAAAAAFSSGSELDEDDPSNTVTLPQPLQKMRRGASSRVKLSEVGPRLTMELVKVTAGLCDGAVLFHRFVTKSEQEAAEDARRVEQRKALKRKRREDQEENVRRKVDAKRAKKERRKKKDEARLNGDTVVPAVGTDEVEATR